MFLQKAQFEALEALALLKLAKATAVEPDKAEPIREPEHQARIDRARKALANARKQWTQDSHCKAFGHVIAALLDVDPADIVPAHILGLGTFKRDGNMYVDVPPFVGVPIVITDNGYNAEFVVGRPVFSRGRECWACYQFTNAGCLRAVSYANPSKYPLGDTWRFATPEEVKAEIARAYAASQKPAAASVSDMLNNGIFIAMESAPEREPAVAAA